MSYKLICRNCKKEVAKTPNLVCVNCKSQKWGYNDAELRLINSKNKPVITKLSCQNCFHTVAKTPNQKCIKCNMPKWGYSDFELENGLVEVSTSATPVKPPPPMPPLPPKTKGSKSALISIVAVIILSGVSALGYYLYVNNFTNQEEEISPKELAKAVALVEYGNGRGTAFLISPTKLLTAAHVVINFETEEVAEEVNLTFTKCNNQQVRAKVLKFGGVYNQRGRSFFLQDYALLEIPRFTKATPLKLGNSSTVEPLNEVLTIGHSLGETTLSFTDGKINSLKYNDEVGLNNLDLFKHNITINPGNSGGPMILKSNSTVIGIIVGGKAVSIDRNGINIPEGEKIANKINNVKEGLSDYDLTN